MIRRVDGWLTEQVGEDLVMMNPRSGAYIGLNAVGARVWALIDPPSDIGAICDALAVEFETTPEACRPEVEAFVAKLETHGAVVRS